MAFDVEEETDKCRVDLGATHYTQPPGDWLGRTVDKIAKEERMNLSKNGRTKAIDELRERILGGGDECKRSRKKWKWTKCFVSAAVGYDILTCC